jgi:outer membrane protein TolC
MIVTPALACLAGAFAGCGPTTSGFDDAVLPRPAAGERPEGTTEAPEDAGAASAPAGPLEITVEDAIVLALENNRAFSVQRLGPARRATSEVEAAAAFDPVVEASARTSGARWVQAAGAGAGTEFERDSVGAEVGLSMLTTKGGSVELSVSGDETDSGAAGRTGSASAGVGLAQPLLRGRGREVNLASVRQAALDTRSSEYELRGAALSLVAEVEEAYWDYVLARRQIELYEESLQVAKEQQREKEIRKEVGKLGENDPDAVRPDAEVALRREALTSARGALETSRIRLLRLLNPPGGAGGAELWERKIVLGTDPAAPEGDLAPVSEHVDAAMRSRPDLNQARLAVERGELEVVKTRNGLLPRLDIFVNLGKTGYADSFGGSVENLDGEGYDMSAGLTFEWAIGNRAARARDARALLSREEAALALDNLTQLAEVDVRTAHVAARTAHAQIKATKETRAAMEKVLWAEKGKHSAGSSAALPVVLAERDVLASRISEVQAVVGYLKSLVELYRLDGSLLERRGIVAPGATSR